MDRDTVNRVETMKVAVRFGETIKAYYRSPDRNTSNLAGACSESYPSV